MIAAVGVFTGALMVGSTPVPSATSGSATKAPTEAAALVTVTEPELSDRYWESVTQYVPTAFQYETLNEIVADSHLIVLGRVVDTTAGAVEPFDDAAPVDALQVTFAIVAIDEVLKGDPQSREPGRILVARLAPANANEALPQDQVILFLKNYARMRSEFGAPPAGDPDDRLYYTRPNAYQAVLRNRDGLSMAPPAPLGWSDAYGAFPSDVAGIPFGELTARITRIEAQQPHPAN